MKPDSSAQANPRRPEKLGWKLGCQAYTFREMSAMETVDVLKNLGIHYVEFYPGQKFSIRRPDLKMDHHLPDEQIAEFRKSSANAT